MSLVEQNIIGLDDKLHKWLRFWPTNALDSRSKITVRETLAFTTGYTGETACPRMDPVVCAEKVLNDNFHLYPAGTHFSYNSDHLRLAAAVAVEAAGRYGRAGVSELYFPRGRSEIPRCSLARSTKPHVAARVASCSVCRISPSSSHAVPATGR